MKTAVTALMMLLGSISAHASDQIQCSDPSLFQYFDSYDEAARLCPQYRNVYVTYDHGYKKFTCGCTQPDNGGGGGN